MICKPCCDARHSECESPNCPCHHAVLDDGGRPVRAEELATVSAPLASPGRVRAQHAEVNRRAQEPLPILDGPRYLREGLPR